MKQWEVIAHRLSKAGFSWGCVATINSKGQTIFVADAHRDDGRRFIVHADDKLSAFVELERQVITVTFYLESIRVGELRMIHAYEIRPRFETISRQIFCFTRPVWGW